jgi:hypothetical protein
MNAFEFSGSQVDAIIRSIVEAQTVRQAVNTAAAVVGDCLDVLMLSFGYRVSSAEFYVEFCRDRTEDYALFPDDFSRTDCYFWHAAAEILKTAERLPNLDDAETYAALLGSRINWGQSSEIAGRELEFLNAAVCAAVLFVKSKTESALGSRTPWMDADSEGGNANFENQTDDLID